MAGNLEKYIPSLAGISLDLYRQINEENKGKAKNGCMTNIFFSPISINMALAMTFAGAKGSTKRQLRDFLLGKRYPKSNQSDEQMDQELHQLFTGEVMSMFCGNEKVQLHIANRLYAHHEFVQCLLEEFTSLLKNKYKSDLEKVNFGNGPEAAGKINQWVSDQTKNKIKDLIDPNGVDPMTRLILVNAIYFKGNWGSKFDAKHTAKRKFHVAPNKEVDVDMMMKYGTEFFYHETDTYQVLGMPYTDEKLKMMIVLPKEQFGLADVEKSLNGHELVELMRPAWHGDKVKVNNVALPKFKLEETVGLVQVLKKLGVSEIFQDADFSGINGARNLVVSDVIHKAFVEVNEEGTEAAAATAVTMVMRCAMIVPALDFICDHPFLFMICGEECTPLFVGRFCCPPQ